MIEYIDPDYTDIFNTLKNNKDLIEYLTSIGALLTTTDYFNKYGFGNYDSVKLKIDELNIETLKNLATVIYDNVEYINEHSVKQLVAEKYKMFEIKIALGFDSDYNMSIQVLKKVYYTYKTCYIDSFFQNNWKNFVPEFDEELIESNETMNSFVEAIVKEFDKLDNIITASKKFKSYKDIPFEYINYLTQLLGFEQKTLMIDSTREIYFRVLAENILDVYSQRGTFASFYLLFYFLGFDLDITEFYFDRRYYYSVNDNNEIIENNRKTYRFYLTENKPSDNINGNFPINEVVSDYDYSDKLQLNNFDDLVSEYGIECVLGYKDYYIPTETKSINGEMICKGKLTKYTGPVYKYFKTNYVRVTPTLLCNKTKDEDGNLVSIASTDENYKNFDLNQLYMLSSLLDFLIPEFWHRGAVLSISQGGNSDSDSLTLNGHYQYINNSASLEGFRMFDSESIILKNEIDFDAYNEETYKLSKYGSQINDLNDFIKNYTITIPNDGIYYTISKTIKEDVYETYSIGETTYTQYYELSNGSEEFLLQNEKKVSYNIDYNDMTHDGTKIIIEDEYVYELDENDVKIDVKVAKANIIGEKEIVKSALGVSIASDEINDFKVKNTSGSDKYIMLTDYSFCDENGIWYNVVEYINSVGEKQGATTRNGFPSFTYPIGRTIKIINTSRFAGGIIKTADTNTAVYPIWMKDSFRGMPCNGRTALYIPKDNLYDVLKVWDNNKIKYTNGYEGYSLKKGFAYSDSISSNRYFVFKADEEECKNINKYTDINDITYFRNPVEYDNGIYSSVEHEYWIDANGKEHFFKQHKYKYEYVKSYGDFVNTLIEKDITDESNPIYKRVEIFGRLEPNSDGTGYYLHEFDKSYAGYNELDDYDNYILLNYDRIINFDDLKQYFDSDKMNTVYNSGDNLSIFLRRWINSKNSSVNYKNNNYSTFTRPVRDFTDYIFDNFGVYSNIIKDILEDDEIAEESLI